MNGPGRQIRWDGTYLHLALRRLGGYEVWVRLVVQKLRGVTDLVVDSVGWVIPVSNTTSYRER